MKNPLKILLSGGGTGGHIFPAIAIANAVKKLGEDTDFLFVGAKGRMEMEKVPAAGFKIEGLWISGFQRKNLIKNITLPFKIISSLMCSREILKRFQPDVVVGTGGYASGAVVRAAAGMGIPTLIHEGNSFPGITNKLLARRADKICVAFEGMNKYFPAEKLLVTGNPVRADILMAANKREDAIQFFGLRRERITLLVIGGSLGAGTINRSILECAGKLTEAGIQIVWQKGKGYGTTLNNRIREQGTGHVFIHEFIQRMDLAYAAADLVVSRAGAISVAELCVMGKAVILVPSPNVAEDHQTKNAMALVGQDAALLVRDNDAGPLLGKTILGLLKTPGKMTELAKHIRTLAHPFAADVIAKEVLKLAKNE